MVESCFVPKGTLYLRYNYDLNKITLARCCILRPFLEMPVEEFLKIDDIIEYAKNYEYKEPEFWSGASDRCKVCNFPKKEINQVGVGFSYACNLNCYHCFYDKHHKDQAWLKELYFKMLENIKGHYLDSIQLTDVGEPFFYYYKIIEYLKSLRSIRDAKWINFLTNANMLSKERIDQLVKISNDTEIKYRFIISIDGITKETYENTRVGGNFEKVIENAVYLNKFFDVGINFTIKKTNISDIPNIKSFFKELGFRKVDIYYDIYDDECKKAYYENEALLKSQFI